MIVLLYYTDDKHANAHQAIDCFLYVCTVTSFFVLFLQILLSAQEQGHSEESYRWTSEKVRFFFSVTQNGRLYYS